MALFVEPIEKLVEHFRHLPGVGYKSAVRMAFAVLEMSDEQASAFAEAVKSVKEKVKFCSVCCNISENEVCDICADDMRDSGVICVVESTRDVAAVEKIKEFRGKYHVLGGLISPIDGIGPEQLNIKQLLGRITEDTKEVIVATNPSVEGESTALYIARLIKPLGITVTRLAYGIPAGGELEFADEQTLFRAIEGRKEI